METDEISVLIETGNQFSIHQTRLSEASPNGLSFPQKKTQASSSQSFKILHKKMLLCSLPLPPNKQKKCNKIQSPPTKFRFFLPAPSHGGALIFFGVGMA